MRHIRLYITALFILSNFLSKAQNDTIAPSVQGISAKYLGQVNGEINKYNNRLISKTEKTLTRLSRWEEKKNVLNGKELSSFKGIFKPRIKINGFTIESSSSYNRSLISNDIFSSVNTLQYNGISRLGLDVADIPLKVLYSRKESRPIFYDASKEWYSITFDIERYKEKWKKLAEQLGPESLTEYGKQAKEFQKVFVKKLQTTAKDKIKEEVSGVLDSISGNINPLQLIGKTPEQLSALFFGQDVNRLLDDVKKKAAQLQSQELLATAKDSMMNRLQAKQKELETKIRYIARVEDLIKKAKASGMLDMMKNLKGKATEEYNKLLQNPEQLAKTMAAKYNLGGVEKILSLLTQFKAGGQALPFSDNANIPFLGKGLSFEIKIKDKFVGFSTGKLFPVFNSLSFNDIGNNRAFTKTPVEKSSYWFLNYRKGYEASNHKGIKLTGISSENNGSNNIGPVQLKKKNTLLVNLYSREKIFDNTWLNGEISKSIAENPRSASINPLTGVRQAGKADFFSLDNISLKLSEEGTFENAGISHQAFFRKVLGAYSNSTDSYLASGGYETGFSVRMKKKSKKISSYVKGSFKKYGTPGSAQSEWSSSDLRARVSYKFKKGQSFQISAFSHSGTKTYFAADFFQSVRQKSTGISADANIVNKRIFGLYNTSFISAGFQKDIFPLAGLSGGGKVASGSYNVSLNQTFLYGEHLLTANVFYTKVSQDINTLFYNSKFDADAGGVFKLNNKLSAGMSLVYGYFKGAYTNAGIKSSLSATVFKKLQLDIDSDIRKNIRLINPVFSRFVNMNCSLKYTIK